MDIHEMFDSSKGAMADVRHRVVFHSAFGIFVIEKIFGSTRVNSDGKTYSVRDIGEQHVMEDLGTIPSLEQWMKDAPIEPWMMGKKEPKKTTHIPFAVPDESTRLVIRRDGKSDTVLPPLVSPRVSVTEIDDGTIRTVPKRMRDILID